MSDQDGNDSVRDARLQSILKKWMDAAPLSFFKTVPKQDLIDSGIPMADLELHGLVSEKNKPIENIPTQSGKREFARILTGLFGNGKEIYQEQVDRAIAEGMHGYNKPSRKINTAPAIQWWRDNKAKTESQLAAAAEADAKRKIVSLKVAELDLEERQRQMDATWIKKADAQESVTGAVLRYHSIVKRALDRDFSKLILDKLTELDESTRNKIQTAAIAAGREVVAKVEESCAGR